MNNKKKFTINDVILTENMSINLATNNFNNNILIVGQNQEIINTYIKPNILQMDSSFILTDPRGMIFNSIGDFLKSNGYEVRVLNLLDMLNSDNYNPLKYVKTEIDIINIVDCFFNNTEHSNSNDEFLMQCEKLLYFACIYYLIDFCKDKNSIPANFTSIMFLINLLKVEIQDHKTLFDFCFESCPKDSHAYVYYNAFKRASGNSINIVANSCMERLRPFLTKSIADITGKDTLEIEKLGQKKTALFIIPPNNNLNFIIPMLYSQILDSLYKMTLNDASPLKVPIHLMINNFIKNSEISDFSTKLAILKKKGICTSIIIENITQLKAIYPNIWKEIICNCGTLLYLGSTDKSTYLFFKNKIKDYKKIKLHKMLAVPSNKCIVFKTHKQPVIDKKYNYTKHPNYKQTKNFVSKK